MQNPARELRLSAERWDFRSNLTSPAVKPGESRVPEGFCSSRTLMARSESQSFALSQNCLEQNLWRLVQVERALSAVQVPFLRIPAV